MTIITRISQLFSKTESSDVIGVSLRQQDVGFCIVSSEKSTYCGKQLVVDGRYHDVFNHLVKEHNVSGDCHLVLSAKYNQTVQVEKPQVPAEEINAAVKWQIKDLVSIAPDDMIVDYYDTPNLAGGVEKINVVCANKHELSQYVEHLNAQQLNVKTITIEEFAFASLMPVQNDAKLLVCKQPGEDMLVLIVKEGCLYFFRRIRGLEQIEHNTQEELALGVIDSLSLEIQRSTDYFERQLKQAPIRSIEVLVPMENEAYLARRLAENTNVAVNLFAMPEGYAEHREDAVCIGATMLHHQVEQK
ncbi:hypothetical protein tinsulaeT_12160 [Thalassotalea insulae]|uniref:MSHA biogenesis protein MshI n=1 Tax=Thalassotalea insulae TaxID=2056778 RepID=A0ABQ6GPR7_9GAMM|nr:hypothetical protein [Thalassotalea insulae]GLX77876.1 hypothetical protein tinsulaeT_12160 [Thalassotalea insulae]